MLGDAGGAGGHDDGGYDHDCAVAETEPRPDRYGPALRITRQQAPSHQVDGGDVVGVQRMAETQGVGEGGGGHEGAVVVEDQTAYCPDEAIRQSDESDDHQGREGDASDVGCARVSSVKAEESMGVDRAVARFERCEARSGKGPSWER